MVKGMLGTQGLAPAGATSSLIFWLGGCGVCWVRTGVRVNGEAGEIDGGRFDWVWISGLTGRAGLVSGAAAGF